MRLIANIVRSLRQEFPKIRFNFINSNMAEETMEHLDKELVDFGILVDVYFNISHIQDKYEMLN